MSAQRQPSPAADHHGSDRRLVQHKSGPLSPDDTKVFIVGRRLKVSRDHIEFRISCPRRAGRERRAALSQLTFTEVVWGVDVVQFVLDVGAFEQIPKPLPLISSVPGEIEHNGYTVR